MTEPRSKGVTIMFKGQVMVTQEPIQKDHDLIELVIIRNRDWVKEGSPLSNQGY